MAAFVSPLTAIVRGDFFPDGCGAGFSLPDWWRLLLGVLLEARDKFFCLFFGEYGNARLTLFARAACSLMP